MQTNKLAFMAVIFVVCMAAGSAQAEEKTFSRHCADIYQKTKKCPAQICELKCVGEKKEDCLKACEPQKCPDISADECPAEFCVQMIDCSDEKICHYKMVGGVPACGDLAYAGQDVECCEGFVRRCGIEFVDATCDMEGKGSVYNLPICIPCGDGMCGQFENRCNCPEDCGAAPDISDFDLRSYYKKLKNKNILK
ncbi:MAG: hypothetical protein KAJ18_00415 [Candidatus Omnitrophica bacterium]|nr:hypothetical protein [Candidatus Omnitrophota bacterium]